MLPRLVLGTMRPVVRIVGLLGMLLDRYYRLEGFQLMFRLLVVVVGCWLVDIDVGAEASPWMPRKVFSRSTSDVPLLNACN